MRTTQTVTISLDPELAAQVDRIATKEHRTRSELLREAFRRYAADLDRWERLLSYGERAARSAGLTSADDVARAVKAHRSRHRAQTLQDE